MNNTELRIGSWTGNKITVEPNQISANGGLDYPRLIIPLKLELKPIDNIIPFTLLNIQAELYFENINSKVSDSIPVSFAYNVRIPDSNVTTNLEFPLDYKRISKIEEQRRDNLRIQIKLKVIIGIYEQNYLSKIENSFADLIIEVQQSHWVTKVLPNLLYGEYFLIEIPKGEKYLEEAWAYIKKADDCFNMWDSKGAFANCREVGTILNKTISEKLNKHVNFEKWKRSYDLFKHLTSLYLHIEDVKGNNSNEKIDVNKNDTEYIIILAKSLVKYAEGLIRTNFSN